MTPTLVPLLLVLAALSAYTAVLVAVCRRLNRKEVDRAFRAGLRAGQALPTLQVQRDPERTASTRARLVKAAQR